MAHDLDSPLARRDSRLDVTDLYVFPGRQGTVLVMNTNTNTSSAGDQPKPGFQPEARYEIKVHLDGSVMEDLTYRMTFVAVDLAGQQDFALRVLAGAEAHDDGAAGTLVAEGRTNDVATSEGTRIWCGQVADPFYVDLGWLAVVNAAVTKGTKLDVKRAENAENSFAGGTVSSIVLEVPVEHPQLRTGRQVGVWCTTKLAADAGGWRQINRCGRPMIRAIFRPDGTDYARDTDTRHPSDDTKSRGDRLAQLVAAAVAVNSTSNDPVGYGEAVARRLLPDVLPYVVGSPAIYGFVEHNGRGLADNAPEAMFSLALNAAVSSGLNADSARHARSSRFPYVVPA